MWLYVDMVNSLAPVSPHLCGRARDAFGTYCHACVVDASPTWMAYATPVLNGLMDDLAPDAQDIRDIAEVGLESWQWLALSWVELVEWAEEECAYEVDSVELASVR